MTEVNVRPFVSDDTCAPSMGIAFVRILASNLPAARGTSVSAGLMAAEVRRVDGFEGTAVRALSNLKSVQLPTFIKDARPGASAWSPPV